MDKIKRFITCNVPVTVCNFKCDYCYLPGMKDKQIKNLALPPLEFAKKFSIDRLGGICYFNLCADGETLMQPQLIEFIKGLIDEGHYVDIITNGTLSKKFDELLATLTPDEQTHLFIKFSFHYIELNKHKMLNQYVENVKKVKNSKISYTIEITPYDDLIPYIEEIKNFSMENFGALPHITVARDKDTPDIKILTKLSREEYKKIWSQFDSEMFNFKFRTFNEQREEFCYAGDWSLFVYLGTGEYRKCYFGDVIGNVCDDSPIKFKACGKCLMPHCFNGHAFLAFGCIPELESPTYFEERDRFTRSGEHWVKEPVASFFSTKLYDSNKVYSDEMKRECIKETNAFNRRNLLNRGINKIRRIFHV